MSDKTGISWTDATWNPVRGCSRVSEGCRHCYAETIAARFSGPGQPYEGLARRVGGEARWTGKAVLVPHMLDLPLRWRKPRKVFVNSMSDLFHESLDEREIALVFAVMALGRRHTFQVLTKRPERMLAFMKEWAASDLPAPLAGSLERPGTGWRNPLPNVWLGVSVEDQATADERIPLLLQTPAAVRFVSIEPCLGAVDLSKWLAGEQPNDRAGASVHGLFGDRCLLDRRRGQNLETPPTDRRKSDRYASVLEGSGGSTTGREVRVGRLSDRDVFGRSEETQGFCSPGCLDGGSATGHTASDAGEPSQRQALGHAPDEPGSRDAGGERAARDSSPRPEEQATIWRGQSSLETDGGRRNQDPVSGREAGAVEDCRDVRREAEHDLGRDRAQELGAHRVGLDWIIVGGESGPKARPFEVAWARSTVAQCKAAGIACFVKQLGSKPFDPVSDGQGGYYVGDHNWPKLAHRAGADPAEWPEDLRVQEFPKGARVRL